MMMRRSAVGIIFLMTALGICGCSSRLSVPTELIGEWETSSDVRYAESLFEISESSITFVSGEEHKQRYRLEKVESTTGRGLKKYVIEYSDKLGGEYELVLNYAGRGDDPQIVFKFQPKIVWQRVVAQ